MRVCSSSMDEGGGVGGGCGACWWVPGTAMPSGKVSVEETDDFRAWLSRMGDVGGSRMGDE